jgi:hypothetical protein
VGLLQSSWPRGLGNSWCGPYTSMLRLDCDHLLRMMAARPCRSDPERTRLQVVRAVLLQSVIWQHSMCACHTLQAAVCQASAVVLAAVPPSSTQHQV